MDNSKKSVGGNSVDGFSKSFNINGVSVPSATRVPVPSQASKLGTQNLANKTSGPNPAGKQNTPAPTKKPVEEDEKIDHLPDSNIDPNNVVEIEAKNKPPEIPVPEKIPMEPKLKRSIFLAIVGIFTLGVGAFFLIKTILKPPMTPDGTFLIDVGKWSLDGEPSVIWNFTEVGKGKLTTNNHTNDYDFIWAIDGNKLSVETDWLYTLNDTYEYKLDQKKETLTLASGEITYVFVPFAEEITETTGTEE